MNKKQHLYCIGQIDQKKQESEKCAVKLFKTKINSDKFSFPQCEDKWPVPVSYIVSKLPKPVPSGKTEWMKLTLSVNFSNIKMG